MTCAPDPDVVAAYVHEHPECARDVIDETHLLNALTAILISTDLPMVLAAWDSLSSTERMLLLPIDAIRRVVI